MSNFVEVDRPTSVCWQHKEKPVWIVHYSETNRLGEHWQAYKAVAHVPKGRGPWTVDNRRIGPDTGFRSLADAMTAAEAA